MFLIPHDDCYFHHAHDWSYRDTGHENVNNVGSEYETMQASANGRHVMNMTPSTGEDEPGESRAVCPSRGQDVLKTDA